MQSRFQAFIRVLYLLPSVVFAFATLSLSWCRVYLSSGSINETLALLQILAKLHDILIYVSLSQVLLYYLRSQLLSKRGTIYGLFSAAYSVAVGSLPCLEAFWYPFHSSIGLGQIQWRARILVCLVLIITIIGLAANPAASIVLLPRLDWWVGPDLFHFMDSDGRMSPLSHTGFSMYIPKKIFPVVVNSSSLPGQDHLAATSVADDSSLNPYVWATGSLLDYLKARGTGGRWSYLNSSLESDPARNIMTSGRCGERAPNRMYIPVVRAYRADTLMTNRILAHYLSLSNPSELAINAIRPNGTAGGP